MSLISLNNVSLRYGTQVLLDCADLNIENGDSMALVGRNGCGKTSLLKLIAGLTEQDSGIIERQRGIKVAYMQQEVPENLEGSVYSVVASGMGDVGKLLSRYRIALKKLETEHTPEIQKEFDDVSHEIEMRSAWSLDAKVFELVARLELEPDLDVATISAGLKRRVLLGRELASEPDMLMLDEPTNHLDIDSVIWLEKFLKSCGKTLIFVSHDRTFLQNLATRVVEVDRGKLISFECDFNTFVRRRDELLEASARNEAAFDKKLAQEEAWLRQGIKARRTRNEGRVRELMRLRKIREGRRNRAGQVSLQIQDAGSTGEKVFDVQNLSVSFGDNKIIESFSTTIFRGDKIGIIGRNGIGKTTLLNALLGKQKLDLGEVKYGTRLQIAYFDQLRKALDPKMRPFDFIGEGSDYVSVNGGRQSVMGYLQNFLFEPVQIMGEIAMLSGGERNRLMLAKLFATPSNVLVLDEPTNDLDMQTIEMLENVLVSFQGTILLVSHDRSFLNNIVTGVFCFEENGTIIELVGGYDEWEKHRDSKKESFVKKASKTISEIPLQDSTPKKRTKLSNKERAELESIPWQIEANEKERAELEQKLNDSDYVTKNYSELEKINVRLQELNAQDEVLFERWEYLSE